MIERLSILMAVSILACKILKRYARQYAYPLRFRTPGSELPSVFLDKPCGLSLRFSFLSMKRKVKEKLGYTIRKTEEHCLNPSIGFIWV